MATRRTGSKNGNGRLTVNSGLPDFMTLNMIGKMVKNAETSIRHYMERRGEPDSRRDINDECGYPTTDNITAQDYRDMFDRNPYAARVVSVMPEECLAVNPIVFEDESEDVHTEFEEAWDDLPKSLRGGSFFEGEEGNPVYDEIRRLDMVSGIGHFGVMLLGIDDGKPLSDPAEGLDPITGEPTGKAKETELKYVRCFDESLVSITDYERENGPRYGFPKLYDITFSDPTNVARAGQGIPITNQTVHWTRLIHVADESLGNPFWGTPRMQAVWNDLMDIRKMLGSDAEAFWRQITSLLTFETHPQLGGDVDVDVDEFKDDVEQTMNTLQRWLLLRGMSAKQIAPALIDPTGHIDVRVASICVKLAIPRRIFEGSERGELASSQDKLSWGGRVQGRRDRHVVPRIVVPFVDRCIHLGVLPEPEKYGVGWPDDNVLSALEKAQVAAARMDVMVKYIQGGVDALMTPMDLLTRELDYTQDEAEAIEGAASDLQDEKAEEQAAQQEGQAQKQADQAAQTPPTPVEVKEGETLVNPHDGTPVGKNPFPPKKPAVEEV